jgi:aminopeptidase
VGSDELLLTAGMLDRPDPVAAWREQSRRQARLIDFLNSVHELRFLTPAGTDLRLRVAGRTWVNGDGRENFPDGEVYTAPVEGSAEGTVYFDNPVRHGGRELHGIRLGFRGGQVVEASATREEGYLQRLLDQDAGARRLGEVGLGCNFALTRRTGNALLDEKIGGTFHLGLGAAYRATGGRNASGLHWDLVGDLRQGGHVEADGHTVSTDGWFAGS